MIRPDGRRPIVTAAQMQEIERRAFASGVTTAGALMDCAGLAVARHARRMGTGRRIVVAAGPGGNGGDGYVAARYLRDWGGDVVVVAFGDPSSQPARTMAAQWEGATTTIDAITGRDVVLIDALFGIGGRMSDTAPEGWPDLCGRAAFRMAIDLPSGMDADTGNQLPWCSGADATVALGALKPAHLLSADSCGHLLIADFDPAMIDQHVRWAPSLWDKDDRRWATMAPQPIAAPLASDHKYRGKVSILSGAMPGAARLAARGAAGAGAGYIMLIGDPAPYGPLDAIVHRPREAFAEALAGSSGVVLIGPGLGRDAAAEAMLAEAIGSSAKLVLDGDALTLLGRDAAQRLSARDAETIVTPHSGEFDRMFGSSPDSKFARTQAACAAAGTITIVHKGRCTIVGKRCGELTASVIGSTWLATAGTGDVLAGAVAARWACIDDAGVASEQAVQLHGRASLLAGPAFSADGLAACMPAAWKDVR